MHASNAHISESFRVGVSANPDTRLALHEALDAAMADHEGLTLVFCAANHNPHITASVLHSRTVESGIAMSTEGELSHLGFTLGHVVVLHLPCVRASTEIVSNLSQLSLIPLARLPSTLARKLGRHPDDLTSKTHTWLLMADGTTSREPLLTSYFARVAPKIGLIGGSFGDGTHTNTCAGTSWVVHHGRVFQDAAALVLLESPRPFHIFQHTHHKLTERWVTATAVSEDGYQLLELDHTPAATTYANLREIPYNTFDLSHAWSHPFGTRFKGRPFPISITGHEGTSLRLGAPIHEGERLCLLEPCDMATRADEAIQHAKRKLPYPPQGALLFHCVGRYLESLRHGQTSRLANVLTQLPIAGFNTHSEQFGSMHINHSITGIMFA